MEKLIVGFGKQGYIVTFGLSLASIRNIKKTYPAAKPIKRVTVGYDDVNSSLEPYKQSIVKYILPLLTGLTENELLHYDEIVIIDRSLNQEYLKITPSHNVQKV